MSTEITYTLSAHTKDWVRGFIHLRSSLQEFVDIEQFDFFLEEAKEEENLTEKGKWLVTIIEMGLDHKEATVTKQELQEHGLTHEEIQSFVSWCLICI